MIMKVIRKIIKVVFLASVLLHAIIFFDNIVVSRFLGSYCDSEGLFISLDTYCSPEISYLRPTFYIEKFFCEIKPGHHHYGEAPLHKGHYCLPPLLGMGRIPAPGFSPPEKTNLEIIADRLKGVSFIAVEVFYRITYLPITGIVFVIWIFFKCLRMSVRNKKLWLLTILIFYVYGALLFYFLKGNKKRESTHQSMINGD